MLAFIALPIYQEKKVLKGRDGYALDSVNMTSSAGYMSAPFSAQMFITVQSAIKFIAFPPPGTRFADLLGVPVSLRVSDSFSD